MTSSQQRRSSIQTGKGLVIIGLLALNWLGANLAKAQTNTSSVTNSAAPSASSVTTGGTNINYQTNNTYNNEMGFGPGIFCRTPTLYVGGQWGENFLDAYDIANRVSGNGAQNYSFNGGIVVPLGSRVIEYCRQMAQSIARDREISSQLSMIRACAALEKEGLVVDPEKFPLLKPCVKSPQAMQSNPTNTNKKPTSARKPAVELMPKTTRML